MHLPKSEVKLRAKKDLRYTKSAKYYWNRNQNNWKDQYSRNYYHVIEVLHLI